MFPDSVSAGPPLLVSDPVPLMMPDSSPAPLVTLMVPLPLSSTMALLIVPALARLSVPPFSVTAPPTSRLSDATDSVPAITVRVVAPPELLVLDRVRMPPPALVSAADPLMAPDRVAVLALVMVALSDSVMALV